MSGAFAQSNVVSLDDGIIEGDQWPLVPDGEYVVRFLRHDTATVFRTPKLFLRFEIIGPTHAGALLYAAFRVKHLKGQPGKNGRFVIHRGSDLVRQLATIHGWNMRLDRISLRSLRHCLLRVRTRTVEKDHKQRLKPEVLRYSVVDELRSIEAGTWSE